MSELNIEFGSNGRTLDGWLCTDIDTCDITKPLPYESYSVSNAYASHVCEHITTHECFRFFQDVYRILKPDGCFRIVVPILERITDRKHAADLILGHGHKQVFSKQSLKDMLWAAGFNRLNMEETGIHAVLDVHDKQIGADKDSIESFRLEAIK